MTALERLQQWDRKYYKYTIATNGNIFPGDGPSITLKAGGRTVTVCDIDLERPKDPNDPNSDTHYPDLEELINAAIDAWHADTTPKNYRILFRTNDIITYAQHWHANTYMAKITAANEIDANQRLIAAHTTISGNGGSCRSKARLAHNHPPPEIIQTWEVNQNWSH